MEEEEEKDGKERERKEKRWRREVKEAGFIIKGFLNV